MKKSIKLVISIALVLSLSMLFSNAVFAHTSAGNVISADDVLSQSGMSEEEIAALDSDIKEFIVNDLLSHSSAESLEYIEADDIDVPIPYVNQVLTNISFDVYAYKSGNTIYIYPTYEFTANKQPKGQDSFSIQMGDALIPYEYGGQIWYKDDETMSDWASVGSMVANTQSANGAEYSGNQLGSPGWSMKFKGCAYVHAQVGSGSSKQFIMSYMHNPNKASYSISFSAYGIGITYNSSSTIYTAATTAILKY